MHTSNYSVSFLGIDCWLEVKRYQTTGYPCLQLMSNQGAIATATINFTEYPLPSACCLIKDYAENQGILAALEQAGIVKHTGKKIQISPYVYADLCHLLIDLKDT